MAFFPLGDRGPVDDAGHHVQVFFVQLVQGELGGVDDFAPALAGGVDHHHDGTTQVGRDFGIQVELEGRVFAHEVRAFTKYEVVFGLKGFVFFQNIVEQGGVLAVANLRGGMLRWRAEGHAAQGAGE